ncbi:MAG: hypothetical protein L0312_08945, partial [Acidobacteria bacterium]|nr:hypothetical protein [Acidobacteriota bacterium]
GATTGEVIAAILRDSPPPLAEYAPDAPPEMERIVSHAMQKNRAERYQTAKDLLSDLKNLQEELMIVDRGVRSADLKNSDALAEESDSRPKASFFSIPKRLAWIMAAALLVGILGFALAYFRRAPELPPLKIAPFTSFPGNETNPSFSPDGNQIAFAWNGERDDNFDIYVKLIGVGAPLRLTNSPAYETRPVWSPDGRYIAFVRFSKTDSGVFTVPALGGSERVGNRSLWKIAVASGNTERIASGENPFDLAVSRQGQRLAYAQVTVDTNIWRIEISSLAKRRGSPVRLISSTLLDDSPQYSPDGGKIVFASTRTSHEEIWMCSSDGSSPVQLTSFNGPPTGTPRWSPDGKQIAFDSVVEGARDIYVVRISDGKQHRLTTEPSD